MALATLRAFIAVYSVLGMVQSMSFVYFTVTLTTVERRFKIPSRLLGVVLSGNEVSQILLSLFLAYYGGKGHRPRWIAAGSLLSALSCFALASLHGLYGPGEDALRLTYEYLNKTGSGLIADLASRPEPILHCTSNNVVESCTEQPTADFSMAPLVLIFASQFLLGVGTTLFYVLGQIYIDDNAKKKNTPKLVGISMALRMVGPTIGFFLGFLCLRVYIEPGLEPFIQANDPRWMGAWWIGWIVAGLLMLLMGSVLALFPRHLPRKIPIPEALPLKEALASPSKESPVEGFTPALRRLLGNKLLMNNIFSAVFSLLGAAGFMTFLVKYLEIQYQRSSAGESLVAGPVIILGSVLGILVSGGLISKWKPPPKYLLFWNVVVGIIWMLAQALFILLACPGSNRDLSADCNSGCDCTHVAYSPMCDETTSTTFFSPCHAGCTILGNTTRTFGNCTCAGGGSVAHGQCPTDCKFSYFLFVVTMSVAHFASSSGRIGNMLVNYRCVAPKDKAFAQGLALWMISVLALIPGPILYGFLYDRACLAWDTRCSRRGNCWYYDKDALRLTLNLTGIGVAVGFDFMVWKQGKTLKLYDDVAEDHPQEHPSPPAAS